MFLKNGWPTLFALAAVSPCAFAQDAATPLADDVPIAEAQPAAVPTEASTPVAATAPAAEAAVPEAERRSNRLVEEVVVTAQKREENLQDVPISISAFSAEALDAKGIDDPKALAQATPGVYYGQTVNFAIIYIRGVGSDAFLPDSDPSVASYIDGIYFPFANGLSQTFGAVERVEVLKGPQGTLFGRNSTGGAFNTITKTPGKETEASVMTSYGNFNDLRTRAYLSVPFGDSLAASVSVTYNSSDNYYEGTRGSGMGLTPKEMPREVGKGARVKLRWNILDNLDLNLAGFTYLQDGVSSSTMPVKSPSLLSQVARLTLGQAKPFVTENYKVAVDAPGYFAVDNHVMYAQLNWHPAWFDVKVLGSKQKIVTDNVFDFDGSDTPLVVFDARGQFADVKTAEIQFLSNGDAGPDWLTWIAGAFYLDQESGFPQNRFQVAGLDLSDGNLANLLPLPLDFINRLSASPLPIPDGATVGLVSLLETKSTAFFTQFTIDFTDWAHLTLGGRYQEENRGVVESSTSVVNLNDGTTTLIQRGTPHSKTHNFSPKISLAFDVVDGTMVYGSYTEGYKSPTYNTVNIYDDIEYVKPEKVKTSELGFKSELFDRLLRFNAAIFENKIEDLQVQFISLLAGGAVNLENAGGARIRGLDVDFQLTPMPDSNPGLVVMAGGTYLDSKYTSYKRGSGFTINPLTGDYSGAGVYNQATGDYTGNRVTRTPKYSGTAGINQLIGAGDGDIELGVNAYYNSGFYYTAQNSPISKEGSYYVIDAQLSYMYHPWKTRVTLFGKNLNEAVYTYSQFHIDTGRMDYLAPPRTYGVRVNWEF